MEVVRKIRIKKEDIFKIRRTQLKFLGHAVKKEGLENLTLIGDTYMG